jgi:integrase
MPDLTQARVVQYMEQRQKEEASNRTINMEVMVLSRAIGYPWKALWPKLKKLEEKNDVGRALEVAEEERVLAAAAANSSHLIYPYLMTLAWTGMRSSEGRMLLWSQADFEALQITVGKSKSEAGTKRIIPMSAALKAALQIHAAFCARHLGPLQPNWYVFPFSNRTRPIDGTKPVTSLKTAWETVREDAGVNCRLHDLRHTFCTKLAEAGVPETTMLDMMGHVSPSMLRRYSHIRAQARRNAIAALEGRVSFGVPTKVPTIDDSAKTKSAVSALVS